MNLRARFDRLFREPRPIRVLANRRDDERDAPPISDDTYERIPDKFKERGGREPDKPRGDGEPPLGSGGVPRPSKFSRFVLALAIVAALYFGYQAFATPKSSEITWIAFNNALDGKLLQSASVKGTRIIGEFREIPTLAEWVDLTPDGRALFASAVRSYDAANPELAKEYEEKLEEKLDGRTVKLVRAKESDLTSESYIELALKDGTVVKTAPVPSTLAPDSEELKRAGQELLEVYELGLRVEQRWTLAPIANMVSNSKGALQMVDAQSGKPYGRTFFKKYECETPAFAFNDQTLDKRLRENLDSYTGATSTDSSTWFMLASLILTIAFIVFFMRMARSARDQFLSGGVARSLAKRYDPNSNKRVTFSDVAGVDQVKQELVEIVDYLKNPAKYTRMGARVPKGTLLFGPPGTGKTLLARAVAGEANVPFFSINGSEFIQMFVGVGASRVRELFSAAKENAPSILFIDEIDAVGRLRGAGVGGGQDEREQTLNQILSEMDGFEQNDSVMVMASTNRPDVLDPALMRPGRFDRHITVGRPSMKGRREIFDVYLRQIPCSKDVDVDKLAKQTSGFTGADIRNYVNEATLWATRNNKTLVEASDFDFAFEKIALGLKRDEIISEENKRKTACHEAGHAVVGWFLPNGNRVHKVTIIPRGRALGVTWSLPDEDKLSYDASEAKASLAHLLAGRAAEKIMYEETTSGVENDLQRATELARDMVSRWGMSETLGPVSFPGSETHPFLGREMTTESRPYSEETARLIDEEIKRIVTEADETARNLLLEKRDLFEALTNALVEEEEVDRDRLIEILGPDPKDPVDSQSAAQKEETPPDASHNLDDGLLGDLDVDEIGEDEYDDEEDD